MLAVLSGSIRLRHAHAFGARACHPVSSTQSVRVSGILGRHLVAERRHAGGGVGPAQGSHAYALSGKSMAPGGE